MSSINLRTRSGRGIVGVICMLSLLNTVGFTVCAQEAAAPGKANPALKPDGKTEPAQTPTPQPARPEKTQATEAGEDNESTDDLGPIIAADQPEHDVGEIWVGTNLKHTFEIRNEGSRPLEIYRVRASCGCTVAMEYDKVIEPGGVGRIPVGLRSATLRGKFNKAILISSNDRTHSDFTLKIKGVVKHYVVAKPAGASFGSMKPDIDSTRKITLTNMSDQPMKLSLPKKRFGTCFAAELVEKVEGQVYELLVHVSPPCKEGRNGALIEVHTNIPKQKIVKVPANALIRPKLQIEPGWLVISRASSKETAKSIKITNNSNEPIHLLDATTNEDKLTLTTKEVEPGREYELVVTIPAGYRPEALGKSITLKFDDSQRPVIDVPILNARRPFRPSKPAMTFVGVQAPAAEFVTLGGTKINTADIKDKAIVLKFYASWSRYSMRSLPNIEKVYQRYKDKCVRFIGISLDDPNDPRKSKRFTPEQTMAKLKELGVTFDVFLDPEHKVGSLFKVEATSLPTLFLIDQSGQVANVYVGTVKGSKINALIADIENLLAVQKSKAKQATDTQATTMGTK